MLTVALLPRDAHCISAGADPVEMRFEITGGIGRLEADVGCEARDVLPEVAVEGSAPGVGVNN